MNPKPRLLRLHNPPEKQKRLTAMKKFVFGEQLPPTSVLIKTSDVGTDLQFASKMLTCSLLLSCASLPSPNFNPERDSRPFVFVQPSGGRCWGEKSFQTPQQSGRPTLQLPVCRQPIATTTPAGLSPSLLSKCLLITVLFPALSFCLLHGGCERPEISFMSYVQHVCHV